MNLTLNRWIIHWFSRRVDEFGGRFHRILIRSPSRFVQGGPGLVSVLRAVPWTNDLPAHTHLLRNTGKGKTERLIYGGYCATYLRRFVRWRTTARRPSKWPRPSSSPAAGVRGGAAGRAQTYRARALLHYTWSAHQLQRNRCHKHTHTDFRSRRFSERSVNRREGGPSDRSAFGFYGRHTRAPHDHMTDIARGPVARETACKPQLTTASACRRRVRRLVTGLWAAAMTLIRARHSDQFGFASPPQIHQK